ncbi:hypothetical protein GCM10010471_26020 [Leucobacter komagatae]
MRHKDNVRKALTLEVIAHNAGALRNWHAVPPQGRHDVHRVPLRMHFPDERKHELPSLIDPWENNDWPPAAFEET